MLWNCKLKQATLVILGTNPYPLPIKTIPMTIKHDPIISRKPIGPIVEKNGDRIINQTYVRESQGATLVSSSYLNAE